MKKDFIEEKCKICGNQELTRIWSPESELPIFQNLLHKSRQEAKDAKKSIVELLFCEKCEYIYNINYNPDLIYFHPDYNAMQDCSPIFQAYLQEEIDFIKQNCKDQPNILEIGCGKGHFLCSISQELKGKAIGFDPSYCGDENRGKVKFIKTYFEADKLDIDIDLVICRNVLEHIKEPKEFLADIFSSERINHNTLIFFEVPNGKWIVENSVFTSIFYEHCSYYTTNSLKSLFMSYGADVISTVEAFSKQYLWILAKWKAGYKNTVSAIVENSALASKNLKELSITISDKVHKCRNKVKSLKQNGMHIAVWGGGGNGVMFCNIVDPDAEYIDCIFDINPQKKDRYIPVSSHQILSPEALLSIRIDVIIVMNKNYMNEINQILKNMHIQNIRLEDIDTLA